MFQLASFLGQTQIQMIENGLSDNIRIKRKMLYWYFTHLHPLASDMIFQAI